MKKQRPITLSGVIRKRLPSIETRMYEGVRQSEMVKELVAEGYDVTLKSFRVLLFRARNAKKPESKISGQVENKETTKEPQAEPEKNAVEKSVKKPVQNSKKMSQQDIENMLKNDIDLDKL